MFGRKKQRQAPVKPPLKRHGRRPIRSSMSGPYLIDPTSRIETFKNWAAATIQYLRHQLPAELDGVEIAFMSLPPYDTPEGMESSHPMFWLVNREQKTIYLFRSPIQRFRGLHEPDEIHRRMFVEWCVYRAVCEYLEEDPWALLPGRFEHY